jgi:hypothetical protein
MSTLWPLKKYTCEITSNNVADISFTFDLAGMSAEGCRVVFTPGAVSALTNDSALVFSVKNPREDLSLSIISAKIHSEPRGTVPFEEYGTDPKHIRCRVTDLKSKLLPLPANPNQPMRSFIGLLTRTDAYYYRNIKKPSTINIAVASRLDGEIIIPPYLSGELYWNDENISFPQFRCTSKLTADDLTGNCYKWVGVSQPGLTNGEYFLQLYQDGAIDLDLGFSAVQTGSTTKDVYNIGTTNSFTRFTYKSRNGYQISKRLVLGDTLDLQPYVFAPRNFSGSETLELSADENKVYYNIMVKYSYDTENYDNGVSLGSVRHWSGWANVLTVFLERK